VKTYFHVDMDAFFVSVEEIFDPSLKGKPVVVGGVRPAGRGFGGVLRGAEIRRAFGNAVAHGFTKPVRNDISGRPSAAIPRIFAPRVYDVLQRFSPVVEMASIDEAYLDMTGTGRLHGPPLKAADRLHQTMKRETGLELLDRYRTLTPGGQSQFRQAKRTECCGSLLARRRASWPRGRAQDRPESAK